MLLSPHEQEKLLLHVAANLAKERRGRGLRLNHPEAVALLSSWILEGARDGRSVAELMDGGQHVLTRDDVMEGVPEMLPTVAGRGDVPRRDEARERPRADPVSGGSTGQGPGRPPR